MRKTKLAQIQIPRQIRAKCPYCVVCQHTNDVNTSLHDTLDSIDTSTSITLHQQTCRCVCARMRASFAVYTRPDDTGMQYTGMCLQTDDGSFRLHSTVLVVHSLSMRVILRYMVSCARMRTIRYTCKVGRSTFTHHSHTENTRC
jgi:hypothetical protein